MEYTTFPLDALDRRILNVLQEDSALTHEALADRVHSSPPTCLRRVRRLVEAGVIARRIAIVDPDRLGAGLTAVIEVTLDRQSAEAWDAFELTVADEPAIQQCYRVSSGPDFVLIVWAADMAGYHAFVHRALTNQANVRNVRAFFAVKRVKFAPAIAV